jgi:GntR family transcriptional regulator/MocR family aminotransferase
MSGTRPDVRLAPTNMIGRTYRRVLRTYGHDLISYQHPAGLPRLRQGLAAMLASTRGLATNPDNLLITRGSQMALALTARALLRPGDAVAVEHPGYRPAWEAFRLAGAEIIPAPIDEHGLDVERLQGIVQRRAIRAVYVTPHHQFPTTVTLSGPRRLKLLQLAAEKRFAIIEDDYDHEFHYAGRPVVPMASIDSENLVIYIGTLSKILAPGLRLGFVVGAPDLIERLVAYRSFVDLQGDAVLECAIAELLDEGLIQRHVRKTRRIYELRLRTLALALRRQLDGFVSFHVPSGGTAIWVKTRHPRVTTVWTQAARGCGVIFDAGSAFTLSGAPIRGARIGFACLTEDELIEGVRRLVKAVPRGYPKTVS